MDIHIESYIFSIKDALNYYQTGESMTELEPEKPVVGCFETNILASEMGVRGHNLASRLACK